ncbi:MAG: bifunctional riboflavin kinase/FAD synthetase [Leptospiraceae bacterium]|nr:bifunctional riboflavin kinase/FAD synthetase [Leptospiraceae bacterium]
MLIVHDIDSFEAPWDGAALTLGVFDGMHLGHNALIQALNSWSKTESLQRVMVTYHPHPDIVLGKRERWKGAELFTYPEKLALLQAFELDAVIFLPFSREFARMTAMRYLKSILLEKLKGRQIVIGYDQCFGRGRKGNFAFLQMFQKRYHYAVHRIDAVTMEDEIISSSQLRQLVQSGQIDAANQRLGFCFFVSGTVVRGKSRGHQLGFPTANLATPESKCIPGRGVYAAIARFGSQTWRAMVNIGHNPTFGHQQLIIEAHLLGFEGDIYGETLRLYFVKRLRDEQRFDSPNDLVQQLEKDKQETAKYVTDQILVSHLLMDK